MTGVVGQWHSIAVNPVRKAAKVLYPNAYASHEEAEKDAAKYTFNCVQRAHANYIENLAVALPLMLASMPVYPRSTAILGGVWLFGRILYATGYKASKSGSNGKGRYRGVFYAIAQLGLVVTAGMSAWALCT